MTKNLAKKTITLLLVLMMVFSVCPLQAAAATSGTFEPVTGVTVNVSSVQIPV